MLQLAAAFADQLINCRHFCVKKIRPELPEKGQTERGIYPSELGPATTISDCRS